MSPIERISSFRELLDTTTMIIQQPVDSISAWELEVMKKASSLNVIFFVVFCLGTVIHCGLSILSNLEDLTRVRWADLIDDFSRLLFSFIQFFFIFKHSNVSIFPKDFYWNIADL